jgi:tryptophanyl-tRNA synthetase
MSEPTSIETRTPSQRRAVTRSAELEAQVLANPGTFRVLTGDRPTGALHVGHYFGSLLNRVRLQNLGVQLTVVIADYQVLTDRTGGQQLDVVRNIIADYVAVGIDPDRSVIFTHSAVPALNQLILPFLSLVSDAELHRNPTVKAETEATGQPPSGLMLTYPAHQAADILFGKANLVPVGLDQLPHLELTRLIARRFNDRYGPVFPEPEALLSSTPLLAGLDGQKMAKSRGNGIALAASADETARVVRGARTDSERIITYEPQRRPEVAALLDILAVATARSPEVVATEIGARGSAALKSMLTDALNDLLAPVRGRRIELAADPAYLDEILRQGNRRARQVADVTLVEVHEALGMAYAAH